MWMALGMAGLSAGRSLLGTYQQRQQQKRKNRLAIKKYHGRVAAQKRKWYQDLSIWHNKSKVTSRLKIDSANEAMRRGYAEAQQGLNQLMLDTAEKNNDILVKYLQESKGVAGAANQGASANRIQRMNYGALMKEQAKNSYLAEVKGTEAYKRNIEQIRRRAISVTNKVNADVMFAPDTPPPIVFDPDSLGQESLSGWDFLSAGLDGVKSWNKWRPGAQDYGDDPTDTNTNPQVQTGVTQ